MLNARDIANEAGRMANTSKDEQISKLANLVQQLAARMEKIETKPYQSPQRGERGREW